MVDFNTNLISGAPQPIYIFELEGPEQVPGNFDSTTGWVIGAAAANIGTTLQAKSGTGALNFDKAAGNVDAFIENTALPARDATIGAYHRVWVFLSSITDVASVKIRLGTTAFVYWEWTIADTELVVGWNRFYLDIEVQGTGVTLATVGVPFADNVQTFRATVTFDAAGDLLTDIRVDLLTLHPQRYSTSKVRTPVATTQPGWVKFPKITTNEHDMKTGQLTTGNATIPVIDGGASMGAGSFWAGPFPVRAVINDIDNFDLLGTESRISLGFRGEIENTTNYEDMFRGVLVDTPHQGNSWSFRVIDPMDRFRLPVLQDASEDNPITIGALNIITVWLQIALSTGNGVNNTTYDVLTAASGAGVSQELFDITTIEAVRDEQLPFDNVTFTFVEPIDDFLEWSFEQVFLAHGIVPVITREGLFSIHVVKPAFGDVTATTFDENNIIANGTIPAFNHTKEDVINQVRMFFSFDAVNDTFTQDPNVEKNQDSIDRFGIRELPITSFGIQDRSVAVRASDRILQRMGNGAPPVNFRSMMSTLDTELGDLVAVTKRNVPDIENAQYRLEGKLLEIFRRGFDPDSSKMIVGARITTFRQGRFRRIAPNSVVAEYDGQTASEQANYASVATAANTLGAALDPAHQVGNG